MGRPPRIHYEGAFYHVMGRGNLGRYLFSDASSKRRFQWLLIAAAKRFECEIHAYCIMNNHFHLLVKVGDKPLGKMMHLVLFRFARYYHWRKGSKGHAFQSRFKAIICRDDAYLLTVLRYIHQNPVRAGLVENPADWPWSSHHSYLIGNDPLVTTNFCLDLFRGARSSVEIYDSFIRAGAVARWPHPDRPWDEPLEQSEVDRPAYPARILPKDLNGLLGRIGRTAGVPAAALSGPSKAHQLSAVRLSFAKTAMERGFTLTDIARSLNRSPATIFQLLQREKQKKLRRCLAPII